MNRILPAIFAALTIFACGAPGSQTETVSGSLATEAGNPTIPQVPKPKLTTAAVEVLETVCTKLAGAEPTIGKEEQGCFRELTFEACYTGILPVDNIDAELGLGKSFGAYQEIIASEEEGALVALEDAKIQCLQEISELSCQSRMVQAAYHEGRGGDFSEIYQIFPLTEGSCPGIFAGNF